MPHTQPIKTIPTALIAPCGMNCRLCVAYTRKKDPCPGCRGNDSDKCKTRFACRIKTCAERKKLKARYCYSCEGFPCDRLLHLDKRYRTKYGMSMIENLLAIRNHGIRRFVHAEAKKWRCPGCGELLCVHKPYCLSCGKTWRDPVKNIVRKEDE